MPTTTCCPRIPDGQFLRKAATVAAVLAVTTGAVGAQDAGVRYTPQSPGTVLVVLEAGSRASPLASLRRALHAAPEDAALAARYVRAALERHALDGDARLLGYAEGALEPWRDDASPPRELWLLRGRLQQTLHRFEAAARDLGRLLEVYPGTVEAMLLAADAARRAGSIDDARRHCLRLQFAGRDALAQLCAAEVLMTLGESARAYDAARAAANARQEHGDAASAAWALAVLADAAQAAGDAQAARAAYERALQVAQPAPLALELAYADWLLERAELRTAAARLDALPPADGVLLRRAVLAVRTNDDAAQRLREELRQRFDIEAVLADSGRHARERALFELDVRGDAATALDYAARNWQVQKGYEDGELLKRAAARAGAPSAAARVDTWRARHRGTGS